MLVPRDEEGSAGAVEPRVRGFFLAEDEDEEGALACASGLGGSTRFVA